MYFRKYRISALLFLSVPGISLFLIRCGDVPKKVVQSGASLSKNYCGSCHQYPSPEILDSETWVKHVLPEMAPRLGIAVFDDNQYVNNPYSTTATVSFADWLKIVAYYRSGSPKTLKPAFVETKPVQDWAMFTMHRPKDTLSTAATTMVSFDTIGHHIYTSDNQSSDLYQWSDHLALQASRKFKSPAVDVQFNKDSSSGTEHGAFTFIGSLRANDVDNGNLTDIDLDAFKTDTGVVQAVRLDRPVQSLAVDFDKDGLTDQLVCGFGHGRGGLYWFKQMPGRKFEKKVIWEVPGAIHAVAGDFNQDGWQDIICLFAYGDEGIWMFLNDHHGGFTSKNLLRFPPVYGSSSFQLVDFNHDGKPDILYTAGDNGDYSRVLKPFHGVYIFLNEGDFKYKQAYFYPVNGATKAMAADFNGDGELDIALIAFYCDLKNNPAEGFTYFEQDKPMHFVPHHIPVYHEGRWICMDVKDYNADGRPDIILGNFSLGFLNQKGIKTYWNTHSPYIVLENTGGKPKSKHP
ncbi:MAG TPA: VCBS repeat-containing protein [Puia sp.]